MRRELYRLGPLLLFLIAAFPVRAAIPCPAQTGRTAVLLIIGQSNSANFASRRFRSAHGDRIVNVASGRCFVAASPLKGADGGKGEPWTQLGNMLVEAGLHDRVVLVPLGMRSTVIRSWAPGGGQNARMMRALDATLSHYRITHVLWHQGESDFKLGTPRGDYVRDFAALLASLRRKGVDAPVFMSVATRCKGEWRPDNPIALAQKGLVDPGKGVLAGVDSDALVGLRGRRDGCHFNAAGQSTFTRAWFNVLRGGRP